MSSEGYLPLAAAGSLRHGGGGRRVPVVEGSLRLPDSRLLGVRLRLDQRQLLEGQEPWVRLKRKKLIMLYVLEISKLSAFGTWREKIVSCFLDCLSVDLNCIL